MQTGQPYLSLIVSARNDDHGGNFLGRMQSFVSGWIAQARRHGLPSELIIVEWNPPPQHPRLQEALTWPEEFGPCEVRFIEVPQELHQRYAHAGSLPLYQMIAKNVGIRRSRGRFVLATNIDILFSDELVAFLAEQRLQPGRMYRIDRHDAMAEVCSVASIEEQLDYCRTHLLRVNAREGTFPVTPEGRRTLFPRDIASADSGLSLGRGWYPVEQYSDEEIFRWVDNDAEIDLTLPDPERRVLRVDLEPGPGMGQQPMSLHVFVDSERVGAAEIDRRSVLRISFSGSGSSDHNLRLCVAGGGEPVAHDPRILYFRIFSCTWERENVGSSSSQPSRRRQVEVAAVPVSPWKQASVLWMQLQALIKRLAEGGPLVTVTIPVPAQLRRAARFYVEWGGFTGTLPNALRYLFRIPQFDRKSELGEDVFDITSGVGGGGGWYPLERFRRESFRWVKNDAEIILPATSGQTMTLVLQVEPGPGVEDRKFELLIRNERAEIVATQEVSRLVLVRIPLARQPDRTEVFTLAVEGGGRVARGDPRAMNVRVFWCGVEPSPPLPAPSPEATCEEAAEPESNQVEGVAGAAAKLDRFSADEGVSMSVGPGPDTPDIVGSFPAQGVTFLHTNGCGDFTLLAREHWFDLRGYPEFDLFSMNIDSVLCYAAHHGGAREEILAEPMRIYHIEHGAGSGWTPEGQAEMFAKVAARGLTFISYQEVVTWAAQMRRLNCPMIFNHENWGLAEFDLKESIQASGQATESCVAGATSQS